MPAAAPTWLVMVRDVSHAVQVDGQPQLAASLILDADTGLARGMAVAPTSRAACAEAMQRALTTQPAGPLPPETPSHVLCGYGHGADITDELTRLLGQVAPPEISETDPIGEAEDVFDSFVGHMSGRRQPDEFPTPADWQMVVTHAAAYCHAQPWLRFSNDAELDLVVKVDGMAARSELVPIWLTGDPEGYADVDRRQVRQLTVATAAVLAYDQRLARGDGAGKTAGDLTLADGEPASYTISATAH